MKKLKVKDQLENFLANSLKELMKKCNVEIGDSVFLACGKEKEIEKILALARQKIAQDLDIIEKNKFAFCWIVDYPMYEYDETLKKLYLVIIRFRCPKAN